MITGVFVDRDAYSRTGARTQKRTKRGTLCPFPWLLQLGAAGKQIGNAQSA
jgi:hypothetical protein